jgi:hypothetical protein
MSVALGKAWKQFRRPQNKFNAERVVTEDGTFDSKKEHRRWCELKLLQMAGEIRNLKHHQVFKFEHNGVLIGSYEADFTYFQGNEFVCEDAKGYETDVFRLKRKMLKAFYGIEVKIT